MSAYRVRIALLIAAFMLGTAPWRPSHAQDTFEALAAEVAKYAWPSSGIRTKPLDELIVLGGRYVGAAKTRHGLSSLEHADALSALAQFHFWAGQYPEADTCFRAELAIRESPETLRNAPNLAEKADQLASSGNIFLVFAYTLGAADAASSQSGSKSLEFAAAIHRLASIHSGLSSYAEAERLYRLSIQITETFGATAKHELMARLYNLIRILRNGHGAGINSEIEQLHLRVLDLWEELSKERKLAGLELMAGHAFYVTLLHSYKEAILYFNEVERIRNYEAVLRRRVAGMENAFGANHPDVISAIVAFAGFLKATGRLEEAEQNYRQALGMAESRGIVDHNWHRALRDFTALLSATNRAHEATELYRHVLKRSRHPNDAELRIDLLSELARLQQRIRRTRDAELSYIRALLLTRPVEGEYWQQRRRATLWLGLAELYADLHQFARAHAFLVQSFTVYHDVGLGSSADRLATLHAASGRWAVARYYLRKVKPPLFSARSDSSLLRADRFLTGRHREPAHPASLALGKEERLQNLIRASYYVGRRREDEFASSFALLQDEVLATQASRALQQMAVRFARGAGEEALLVRARQDALGALDQLSDIHTGLFPFDERDWRQTLDQRARIGAKLAEFDAALKDRFPALQQLLAPEPSTVAEVQGLLRDNEALVVTADLAHTQVVPEETLIWVVTKTKVRWVRSGLGAQALSERVAALRCGLDHTLWRDASLWPERTEEQKHNKHAQIARRQRCLKLLKAAPRYETVKTGKEEENVQVLPFDVAVAHELYTDLLAPAEDLIKEKHLILVPSGALTTLPFHVLLSSPPKSATAVPGKLAAYRKEAWLGTRQPISVLPSVASLRALRQHAKPSAATKPYLGIGNPLLDGPDATYAARAKVARDKQQCPRGLVQRIAQAAARPLSGFTFLFRGPQADIEKVREWTPLPETADELCAVARGLGATDADLLLGAGATETALKALSEPAGAAAGPRLSAYRIIHFATHGALTGEVKGSAEPGLILTPPPPGTRDAAALERDDGFLSASEIAGLRLDADWVILSACNTAAAAGESAEALSGMARGFFYAGARALLVSHWEVESDAAVKLTTRALAELKANSRMGRSEALRTSMRALIETGKSFEAHPSVWAPFVVVGEGGPPGVQ